MTSDSTPASPSRSGRSLGLKFAIAFLLGVVLVVGAGGIGLYAYGQQYDGRVLPGVRVGSTDLSGLSRDEAKAAIAKAYSSLGAGKATLTGPDGPVTVAYADVARGPDTAAILDAALAAGRGGEPLLNLIGAPQAAIRSAAALAVSATVVWTAGVTVATGMSNATWAGESSAASFWSSAASTAALSTERPSLAATTV